MQIYILICLCISQSLATLTLSRLSYTRIPFDFSDSGFNNPSYQMFSQSAVKAAYHGQQRMLYVISGNEKKFLHIYDLNNPAAPVRVYTHQFDNTDGFPTDVTACDSSIVVTLTNPITVQEGHMEMFLPYNRIDKVFTRIHRYVVGAHPKAVRMTSDCNKVVVVSEGVPGMLNGEFKDPYGQVDIYIVINTVHDPLAHAFISTSVYDSRNKEYEGKGVRYIYKGEGQPNSCHKFGSDLEPEAVTISTDDRYAFVSLQENNAIVKIDLSSLSATEMYALGIKNWSSFDIDASDRNGISLLRHSIYSFYQPGAIAYGSIGELEYLVTANTGKMKHLTTAEHGFDFSDGIRCNDAMNDQLIDTAEISEILHNSLRDENALGRVFMSKGDGHNIYNLIQDIHVYGGRSLGLWNATSMALIYDTGDDLEQRLKDTFANTFNGDCSDETLTPGQEMDSLSDEMGPEPTSVAVGLYQNTFPAVISGTRAGVLYVYSMRTSHPEFESIHREGDTNDSWGSLYNAGRAGNGRISDVGFISVNVSSTSTDLVYVIGAATGSLSIYELQDIQ